MNIIVASLITLGVIGLVAAIVLYFVAQKFKVEEDPRIEEVESVLPGANCGGCGFPGCHGFADACVKSTSLDGKLCPVGGQPVMSKIATILGMSVADSQPKVAVVRCNGSCSNRQKKNNFDGVKSCRISNQLYAGETDCAFGCLGFGDCVEACKFDAIHINTETGLPVVDEDKCTACGLCAKICPKHVIELRNKGVKNRRVFVSCINKDKGGVARKACSAACIGCGKCAKTCPFNAITIENNVAYIDFNLCRLCRKCVAVCPTGAIHDVNFPTPAPAVSANKADVAKPIEVVAPKEEDQKVKEEAPKTVDSIKPAETAKPAEVENTVEVIKHTENPAEVENTIEIIVEEPAANVKSAEAPKPIEEAPKLKEETSKSEEQPDEIQTDEILIEVVPKENTDIEIVEQNAVATEKPAAATESEKSSVEIEVEVESESDKPSVEIKSEKSEEEPTVEIEIEEEKPEMKVKVENPKKDSSTKEVDVNSLIDPEMRVVPREKREKRNEKPAAEQQTLF